MEINMNYNNSSNEIVNEEVPVALHEVVIEAHHLSREEEELITIDPDPKKTPEIEPEKLPGEDPGVAPEPSPDEDDDDDDNTPFLEPAIGDDPNEIDKKTTIF
jgi:hypothetical protein